MPCGNSLMALSGFLDPPQTVTVVRAPDDKPNMSDIVFHTGSAALVRVLNRPAEEYRLQGDETTFYMCRDRRCLPPMHKDAYLAKDNPE